MVLDYASVAQCLLDVGRATHFVPPRPEPPAPSGAFRLVYLPRRRELRSRQQRAGAGAERPLAAARQPVHLANAAVRREFQPELGVLVPSAENRL